MKLPLVSILMTSYNRDKFIGEAIESVILSNYSNWELIIVDDCSTDKTTHIAKNYALKDNRIRVYENQKNLGDYANRNMAASYATGLYLKYLDADDLIYPHGLSIMVNSMMINPKATIGISDYKETGSRKFPYFLEPEEAYHKHFFLGGLLYPGPTGAIYKTSFFKQVGGFATNFGVASDLAYNLQCAQKNPVVIFQRDLFWWRPHDGQQINLKQNDYENLNNRIIKYYLTSPDCPLKKNEAKIALLNHKTIQARKVLTTFFKFEFKSSYRKLKELEVSPSFLILAFLPKQIRLVFS